MPLKPLIGDGQLARERRAVGPAGVDPLRAAQDAGGAGGQVPTERLVVLRPVGERNQQPDVLAQGVGRGMAEQVLRSPVGAADAALRVDGDDGVEQAVEEGRDELARNGQGWFSTDGHEPPGRVVSGGARLCHGSSTRRLVRAETTRRHAEAGRAVYPAPMPRTRLPTDPGRRLVRRQASAAALRRRAVFRRRLGTAVPAQAPDWPQWRGPGSSAVAAGTPLPTRWSATEQLAWRSPLAGAGRRRRSSSAIA